MPENLRCLEGIEYKPTSTAFRLKVYVAGLHRKKGALVERPLVDFAIWWNYSAGIAASSTEIGCAILSSISFGQT